MEPSFATFTSTRFCGGRSSVIRSVSLFAVPSGWEAGLYAVRVTTPAGVAVRVLNRPQVWWAQGDGGTTATPGGWVRAFGKNFALADKEVKPLAEVRLDGPRSLTLRVSAESNALKAELPADLQGLIEKWQRYRGNVD